MSTDISIRWSAGGPGMCDRCGTESDELAVISGAMIGAVSVCPECAEKFKTDDDEMKKWVFSHARR